MQTVVVARRQEPLNGHTVKGHGASNAIDRVSGHTIGVDVGGDCGCQKLHRRELGPGVPQKVGGSGNMRIKQLITRIRWSQGRADDATAPRAAVAAMP